MFVKLSIEADVTVWSQRKGATVMDSWIDDLARRRRKAESDDARGALMMGASGPNF